MKNEIIVKTNKSKQKTVIDHRLDDYNKYKKTVKKSSIFSKIKKVFLLFTTLGLLSICVFTLVLVYLLAEFAKYLPDFNKDLNKPLTGYSVMYDRNGLELYKLKFGGLDKNGNEIGGNRVNIDDMSEVPEMVRWAFIFAEDNKFYEHAGIEPVSMARCIFNTYILKSNACGGSTIDQQLLYNTTLKEEKAKESKATGSERQQLILSRKLKEIILALRLDKEKSKDEILKYYLNIVPFNSNIVGLKTAAYSLFSKDIKDLTLSEASLLAGLVNAPGELNPSGNGAKPIFCDETVGTGGETVVQGGISIDLLDKDSEGNPRISEAGKYSLNGKSVVIKAPAYKCRQLYVLSQFKQKLDKVNVRSEIVTQDMISSSQSEVIAFKKPVENMLSMHFTNYAIKQLQNNEYILNDGRKLTKEDLYNSELKIYTTLDSNMQEIAQNGVKDWIDGVGGAKQQFGFYNGAMSIIDNKTNELLVMVGSKDPYSTNSEGTDPKTKLNKFDPQVNIMDSIQNTGSTAKPIGLIAGLESGDLNPASFLPNMPVDIQGWKPQNAGNFTSSYQYNTSKNFLRQGLRDSTNRTVAQAADIIGVDGMKKTYEKLGYTTFQSIEDRGVQSMISADIYPVEHINAYSSLANNGIHRPIQTILEIKDKFNNTLWKYDQEKVSKQVLDPRAVYLLNDMLYNYGEGGPSASINTKLNGYHTYGKSGTSDDNRDTMYVMYNKSLTFGMWVGNNDNSLPTSQLAYGYNAVLPGIAKIMNKILPSYPNEKLPKPAGIVEKDVCTISGKLPNPANPCPGTVKEIFIADKLPPIDDTMSGQVAVCTDKVVSDPKAVVRYELARPIDIAYGYSKIINWPYLKTISPKHQKMFDTFSKQKPRSAATQCSTDYNLISGQPSITPITPISGQNIMNGSTIVIAANTAGHLGPVVEYKIFFDNNLVYTGNSENVNYSYTIPNSTAQGPHNLQITVVDSGSRSNSILIPINIVNPIVVTTSTSTTVTVAPIINTFTLNSIANVTMNNAARVPVNISATHSGSSSIPTSVSLHVSGDANLIVPMSGIYPNYNGSWTPVAGVNKTYQVTPVYSFSGGTVQASPVTIKVN